MTRQEEQLRDIETTQEQLRQSIETSRRLAEKSQRLLDQHRRDVTAETRN